MTRSKSKDEVEELRGKVRELQKENKELKKTINRLQKNSHRVEELEELFKESEEEFQKDTVKAAVCSCGGKIEKVDLGVRTMFKCQNCGKRETKKK